MTQTLAPWTTAFAFRDGVVLHNDLTGRTLRLRGPAVDAWRALRDGQPIALDPDLRATFDAAGFLAVPGENPWPRVAPTYPVRARWVVWTEHEGAVVVMAREAGTDQPWTAQTLEPLEALVWHACDGQHTTAELIQTIAARHGGAVAHEALSVLLDWTNGRYQLIKLLDAPLGTEPPPHFFSWIHDLPRAVDGGTGAVDLADYHRETIRDATEQFEERETTLSHLLRFPSAVLDGRAWGAALVDALADALPPGARVLEVGGGTGWLAHRALERRPDLEWTIVDLSPALQRGQRARARAARLVRGDAQRLPIASGSIDCVISNEVIADLPAERVDPAAPPALVSRLGVVPAEPRVTNVGALRFVEEIARVLRPGGAAWLSEYGDFEGEPVEAEHLDHPEVGIEFGVLGRAAEALGLRVTHTDVVAQLGLRPVPVLASPPAQFAAVQALVRFLGGTPPDKRAWTREALAEAIAPVAVEAIHHLAFLPADARCMTFPSRRVRVLQLNRP